MNNEKRRDWDIIGGGRIECSKIVNIGEGYRVPDISEFVDGLSYERTDGRDWYKKSYDKYQKGDVTILIEQRRVRVNVI